MESLAKRIKALPMSDIEIELWHYFRRLCVSSVQIRRAQSNYYDLTLEQRREFLNAPSTYHLCKTIVMENTAYDEAAAKDPFYPKYVAVIVQYEGRMNAERVMKFMKDYQNANSPHKLPRKAFHFRLADEEVAKELTGYGYNAITPFLMKTNIPIIISKSLTELTPKFFWMGGGEVELKLGMSVDEFLGLTKAHVVDIGY